MTIGTKNKGDDFTLDDDALGRHVHVIGQTGVGKSELLKNMIAADLAAGRGVAVIDPHGDLAEAVLGLVPPSRFHQVRYVNPADDCPVPINPLWGVPLDLRPHKTDAILSAFSAVWEWSIDKAPIALPLLRNAIRTALDCDEPTFRDVLAIVNGAAKRWKATDPMNRAYWQRLEADDSKRQKDTASSVSARLDTLLATPEMRGVLCQKPTLDIFDTMREGRILIVNLNKGKIGELNARLLGAFIVNDIVQAAFAGACTKWDNDSQQFHQRSFSLYADEFHNFATESFSLALSEARKRGLRLVLAHQFMAQVPDGVMDAVLGNAGTTICFRVGAGDADKLASHMGGILADQDLKPRILKELPNFTAIARVLQGGAPNTVRFNAARPPLPLHDRVEQVVRNSRTRFGRSRALVEASLSARPLKPKKRRREW